MGRLSLFEQLAKLHAQLTPQQPAGKLPETLDPLFAMPSDDMVRF
jgi:hypothetical protein